MDVKTQSPSASNADQAVRERAAPETAKTAKPDGDDQPSAFSFFSLLLKLVLAVLVLRTFIFSPFSIPSESMMPKLWNGDYLIASKWPYGFSGYSLPLNLGLPKGRIFASQPKRGDIVIFKHPVDEQDYIKRVIGLPGDTVGVLGGQIVLNGKLIEREPLKDMVVPVSPNSICSGTQTGPLDAPVCEYKRFREQLPGGVSYEVIDIGLTEDDNFDATPVPEGALFLMGDNRDRSLDSRSPAIAGLGIGLVPQDNLVGRAEFITWSTDGSAQWLNPVTWFSATRSDRIGRGL